MELLVVMFLIGAIAAIAIPAFVGWLPSYRLRAASSEMFSNFQFARGKRHQEPDRLGRGF